MVSVPVMVILLVHLVIFVNATTIVLVMVRVLLIFLFVNVKMDGMDPVVKSNGVKVDVEVHMERVIRLV
tara:strand:- start:1883 stop:2089 length:207 start_codon:yes stop_codon:yes gene_type:complete